MEILIKVAQFLLSFSLLVIVHEFGHFLFAKIFGVRVERFQLFFGKAWASFTLGETVYAIGWVPFGGFVKLSGMIDESMDVEQMKQDPQPWEFRTKPAWQRMLIMVGGVLMNVVLAFVIYVGMSWAWGEQYISNKDMVYGYAFSEFAEELGFEDGDKVLTIAGEEVLDYSKILPNIAIESDNRVVEVERDGEVVALELPVVPIQNYTEDAEFVMPRYPFIVQEVVEGLGADKAGLMPGDSLVAFNGEKALFFDEYTDKFTANAGQTVELGVVRDSAGVDIMKLIPVAVSEEGKIGAMVSAGDYIKLRSTNYSFWESIPVGVKRVGSEMNDYWKQLKMVVRPETEAYKSLGGPIAIGSVFPSEWNWMVLWRLTAMLSVVLAIMNILPIPAFDGGHVLFLLIEVITRRKPSDKVLIYAQSVGLALMLFLMIYVTWNDIARIFIH
ncbi:MAG: RIP metalloprotease RseP [Tidjanibacter sp.]|nr:RIP metalloprotease RseP [Tidjanibacter sp.]